jgi:hypothetical protein
MADASDPPVDRATALFERLGYTVSERGPEFTADRKWRTVRVTVLGGEAAAAGRALTDGGRPTDGGLRCFVTPTGYGATVRDRLARTDPAFDWAVVEAESPTDYEVLGV